MKFLLTTLLSLSILLTVQAQFTTIGDFVVVDSDTQELVTPLNFFEVNADTIYTGIQGDLDIRYLQIANLGSLINANNFAPTGTWNFTEATTQFGGLETSELVLSGTAATAIASSSGSLNVSQTTTLPTVSAVLGYTATNYQAKSVALDSWAATTPSTYTIPTSRISDFAANTFDLEEVQDIAGGMFTGNVESGITTTYNDTTGKIDISLIAGGSIGSVVSVLGADGIAFPNFVHSSQINVTQSVSDINFTINPNTITDTEIDLSTFGISDLGTFTDTATIDFTLTGDTLTAALRSGSVLASHLNLTDITLSDFTNDTNFITAATTVNNSMALNGVAESAFARLAQNETVTGSYVFAPTGNNIMQWESNITANNKLLVGSAGDATLLRITPTATGTGSFDYTKEFYYDFANLRWGFETPLRISNTVMADTIHVGESGTQIMGSSAALQVNGIQRTGDIYLHEGGGSPTTNSGVLRNVSGNLQWEGEAVLTGTLTGYVDTSTTQTIGGTKTFSVSPIVPTPAAADNTTKSANTSWVNSRINTLIANTAPADHEHSITFASKTADYTIVNADKNKVIALFNTAANRTFTVSDTSTFDSYAEVTVANLINVAGGETFRTLTIQVNAGDRINNQTGNTSFILNPGESITLYKAGQDIWMLK